MGNQMVVTCQLDKATLEQNVKAKQSVAKQARKLVTTMIPMGK